MMTLKFDAKRLACVLSFVINLSSIDGAKTQYVTCGSVIKLINSQYGFRLHSHDVKYGFGSGQQSVTGIDSKEDVGSHWVIKAGTDKICERGEVIKCGDIIRLEHLTTKKNLHSHLVSSPLSAEQEVSCYGNDGNGDAGDHWELICSGDGWRRDTPVKMRHVDTDSYLAMTGRSFGRPISGQMEVVCLMDANQSCWWTTAEGIFIVPKNKAADYPHTEL